MVRSAVRRADAGVVIAIVFLVALVMAVLTALGPAAGAVTIRTGLETLWLAPPARQPATPLSAGAGAGPVTLRYVVAVPAHRGRHLRVVLSNQYGDRCLVLGGVTVRPLDEAGQQPAGPLRTLELPGGEGRCLPAGMAIRSAFSGDLAPARFYQISVFLPQGRPAFRDARSMRLSRINRAFVVPGDALFASAVDAGIETPDIAVLARVDADTDAPRPTVVISGDSLSDGFELSWAARLSDRLAAAGKSALVVNAGIGGNHISLDKPYFGGAAQVRMARDVFDVPNVRDVVIFEGINDLISTRRSPEQLWQVLLAMTEAAQARGLRVQVATLSPALGFARGDVRFPPAREADRIALNRLIRAGARRHGFALLDFDAALRDPQEPSRLNPRYDSGDHLHINVQGTEALAAAADPALFDAL